MSCKTQHKKIPFNLFEIVDILPSTVYHVTATVHHDNVKVSQKAAIKFKDKLHTLYYTTRLNMLLFIFYNFASRNNRYHKIFKIY